MRRYYTWNNEKMGRRCMWEKVCRRQNRVSIVDRVRKGLDTSLLLISDLSCSSCFQHSRRRWVPVASVGTRCCTNLPGVQPVECQANSDPPLCQTRNINEYFVICRSLLDRHRVPDDAKRIRMRNATSECSLECRLQNPISPDHQPH